MWHVQCMGEAHRELDASVAARAKIGAQTVSDAKEVSNGKLRCCTIKHYP